jgi:hypothetical protein
LIYEIVVCYSAFLLSHRNCRGISASYAATLDLYLQNIEIRDWNDENDDAFLFSRERLQVLAASMLPVV